MAARTVNEALFDALVRHQTYLLRYSGFVRNRVWELLAASEKDVTRLIRNRLEDSAGGLTTPVEVRRMQALLAAVEAVRREGWEEAGNWLKQEMVDLSYQEPIQFSNIIQTVSPVLVETVLPAPRLLRAIALSRPFEGRLLKDWVEALASEDIRRLHAQVQLGMVAGETGDAIARRVAGTGLLKGTDGVTQATFRSVQALTRTAVQHVANSARNEMMLDNADIMLAEQFVATLDSRTTPICRANDGKQFGVGLGPKPPLHIACRSLRVAVLDGERLGFRPYKASTTRQLLDEYTADRKLDSVSSREDLPRGTKGDYDEWARKRVRELTGRVSSNVTYQQWLQRQTVHFQDDTLGVAKARLFRAGEIKLDQFVAADGSELTLAQLATKHPGAFRAAGMEPADFR